MQTIDSSTAAGKLGDELAGLDRLDGPDAETRSRASRAWSATWPVLSAIGLALVIWQLVYWSGWKPPYVLPSPATVLSSLWEAMQTARFWEAIRNTMQRATVGYSLALALGVAGGCVVAAFRPMRVAFGSLITGLQTMPSIAWFPAAILFFGLNEQAILFVVVIGAAPSIANGIIAGVDTVPPVLVRAGRVLGARGFGLYRRVVLPAALPSAIAGLKQGWAFAWRSLMAGELLVVIANKPSIGVSLDFGRDFDKPLMFGIMIVILVIGIVVDAVLFSGLERAVLRRRGLGKG